MSINTMALPKVIQIASNAKRNNGFEANALFRMALRLHQIVRCTDASFPRFTQRFLSSPALYKLAFSHALHGADVFPRSAQVGVSPDIVQA